MNITNSCLRHVILGAKTDRPARSMRSLPSEALRGVVAAALVGALASCAATKATIPIYPAPSEASASTLRFDNQISDSIWSLRGPIYMEVAIDGFSPTEGKNLPTGQTTMHLAPGSHEMTVQARLYHDRTYFNPSRVAFDTEPGKSYAIRFQDIGTQMKSGYGIQYTGWPTEQTAGWPSEVYIANPLFGALQPFGGTR